MRRAIPLVLLLTLVWGTTWPLFPMAVREVSVWTFRAASLVGAGLLLLAIARVRGESLRIPRGHGGTVLAASWMYLVVWNIASTYAAILIPSGQAAILGFTMPLWAALVAWVLLGQAPGMRVLLALVAGGVGVGLLIFDGVGVYAKAPLGFALGLLSGFGWALGTVLLKRRPVPVSSLVLTGWQLLVAALPVVVTAFRAGRWPMVHAVDDDHAGHRLHHAGADGDRQRGLVRDRGAAAGQHRRALLGDGAGRGHGRRAPSC